MTERELAERIRLRIRQYELKAVSDSIVAAFVDEICNDVTSALTRAREEGAEQRDRYHYWSSHGHQGLYGDDGEMQCSECGVDYKRDPLGIVALAHVKAKEAYIARMRQEGAAAMRETCAQFIEKNTPYQQGIGSVGIPMAQHVRSLAASSVLEQVRAEAVAEYEKTQWASVEVNGKPIICSICGNGIPLIERGWHTDGDKFLHIECSYQQTIKTLHEQLAALCSAAGKEGK